MATSKRERNHSPTRAGSRSRHFFSSIASSTRSNIPRSQGNRETSPSRYAFVTTGRGTYSQSSAFPRSIDGTQDTADLLPRKLSGHMNKRYDYSRYDDDVGSKVSSLHSESMSQFGVSSRCTDDVNEILRNRPRYGSTSNSTTDMPTTSTSSAHRMNPDEIFKSIRQTTADIQNLSINSKVDADDVTKGRDGTSQDNGLEFQGEFLIDDSDEDMPSDPLSRMLKELSNHDKRQGERKRAMDDVISMVRKGGNGARWDEHLKTLLLLLIETLGDQDVSRAAEDCAVTLAMSLRPERSVVVLGGLTDTMDYPLCVAVIKTMTQVIELMNKEGLLDVIHRLIPGLIKGFEHEESPCRKASCFALVALYRKIGDNLMPYLYLLTGSKLKLLNLYIKRAEGKPA